VWNPEGVDQALVERLRSHFDEAQLVELGYFVALTYGQQRWIKTLGIGHGEVKVPGVSAARGGIAPEATPR
jgi:hypothetical protein